MVASQDDFPGWQRKAAILSMRFDNDARMLARSTRQKDPIGPAENYFRKIIVAPCLVESHLAFSCLQPAGRGDNRYHDGLSFRCARDIQDALGDVIRRPSLPVARLRRRLFCGPLGLPGWIA